MAKLKFSATMSLDGYVAGPNQSLENPLGEGGLALHEWAFATKSFRDAHDLQDRAGETGLDDEHAARWNENVGATIMGRNMFGPIRGAVGRQRVERLVGRRPAVSTHLFSCSPIMRANRCR